jgi:excinuclease UvrABC helicase subunit UvrB
MYRCDGCGEVCEENELTELEFFQGARLNELQEKTDVKIAAKITTGGIEIEASKDNLVYRIIIPKFTLDEAVDITIPIENALDDVMRKMID